MTFLPIFAYHMVRMGDTKSSQETEVVGWQEGESLSAGPLIIIDTNITKIKINVAK